MTVTERARVLRRHGFEPDGIAAVLGVDVADVVASHGDSSHEIPEPSGGASGPFAETSTDQWSAGSAPGGGVEMYVAGDTYSWLQVGRVVAGHGYAGMFANQDGLGQLYAVAGDDTTNNVVVVKVQGDANRRWTVDSKGKQAWSAGTDPADLSVERHPDGGALRIRSGWSEAAYTDIYGDVGIDMVHDAADPASFTILTASKVGEAFSRFRAFADGHMQWGGGAAQTDVTLKREDLGWDKVLYSDAPIITGADPSTWSAGLTYVGHDGIVVNTDTATQRAFEAGKFDDAIARIKINSDGKMEWGDGTGVADVSLGRDPGGSALRAYGGMFVNSDLVVRQGDAQEMGFGDMGPAGEPAIYFGPDFDTLLYRAAAGVLEIPGQLRVSGPAGAYQIADRTTGGPWDIYGSTSLRFLSESAGGEVRFSPTGGIELDAGAGQGIKLKSPDGTQTKTLRLSDAGAVELV